MSEVTIPPVAPPQATTAPQPNAAPPAPVHTNSPILLAPHADFHNGRLTRAGMEAAIKRGGSVLHDGKVIARVEELPSETQLAKAHVAADRRALAERRTILNRREADARSAGTYELDKHLIEEEKAAIDREAARITVTSSDTEEDAIADVQRRRQALDAEEAQLKAAQASAKQPAKK